ncbi:MAG: hypothetical protein EA357_01565 [Micavibrio sp.]|nr:MAG: hypothetical protein EA357_01565 [Micavibrio sp.]
MARYHGYDKQHIIQSLKNAEEFMRGLDIGPATTAFLDVWAKKEPYRKLEAAKTDEELVTAVRKTEAGGIFLRSHDIFRAHALRDTDGTARGIYKDLACWGAFSGMVTQELRPSDVEESIYLFKFYKKYIDLHLDSDMIVSESARDRHPLLRDIEKDYAAKTVGQFCAILRDGLPGEEQTELVLSSAFAAISGLEEKEGDKLKIEPSLKAFGIESPYQGNDFQQMQASMQDFMPILHEVLEEFEKLDEAERIMVGSITKDQSKSGVLFIASDRAAQAVMRALPDQTVLDYNGDPMRFAPPRPKISRLGRPK